MVSQTYGSAAENIAHGGCHIYVLADDKVSAKNGDLVLSTLRLPPVLLPDDPHSRVLAATDSVCLLSILCRSIRYHKLQPLHRPQMSFEPFSSLYQVEHRRVVCRLGGEGRIVGGGIKEW